MMQYGGRGIWRGIARKRFRGRLEAAHPAFSMGQPEAPRTIFEHARDEIVRKTGRITGIVLKTGKGFCLDIEAAQPLTFPI